MEILIEHDASVMDSVLIPQAILGLQDTEDEVYYNSLKALCLLVPKYFNYLVSKDPVMTEPILDASIDVLNVKKSRDTLALKPAQFSVIELVENVVVPHTLKLCASESSESESLWPVLDMLIQMWKTLVVLIGKVKIIKSHEKTLLRISRSLLKTFLLVLKILEPDMKVELLDVKLYSEADCTNDSCIVLWFPIVIELCIPFLKDDNMYMKLIQGCSEVRVRKPC
jgi:hypothetical protein